MSKPIFTSQGGTFREQILQYSQHRMTRDKSYKRDVVKSLVEKRRKKRDVQKGSVK